MTSVAVASSVKLLKTLQGFTPLLSSKRWARYRGHLEVTIDKKVLSEPLAPDDPRLFLPIKAPYDDMCPHVFNDKMCNKFINMMMHDGYKNLSRQIMMSTLERIKRTQVKKWLTAKTPEEQSEIECNPVTIFHRAVENCMPVVGISPVTRGGINYQVPGPITETAAKFMSMRWLIHTSREKFRTVHMDISLAKEILDAFNKEGRVYKKKLDLHKLAETNRAYAHYRWA